MKELLESYEGPLLTADGFDDAIMGVDTNAMRVVYSVSKCLVILEKEMEEEEAMEYFLFNVHDAYVGEETPIWCWDY